MNFVWGTDLHEAMNDIRTRIDRVRNRLPEDADPPVVQKFDSNAQPIMGLAVESTDGALDRVVAARACRRTCCRRVSSACPAWPRSPSAAACAVRFTSSCRAKRSRRSTSRSIASSTCSGRRTRTFRSARSIRAIASLLLRSQGQFQDLDQIRNLVVLTKNGVPVYLKDIADVVDSTEDNRSVLRINGRPGVRLQVTKQSGTNTVQIAQGVRAEIERINREVPGVKISLLDDSAKFIERSITAVQEHVMIGSVLVVLIIFLFLRNFRSTLIVCTAIPISVVGTFALLYFGGLTLNTMTFGGLALGVGMIVDAAIVVLENSFRHMEHHGKDRMTASIDGSEEVWSAILASILTHIAVFVPLLFLEGVSSILFRQLSIVVVLLAGDVAVRGGHARAGAVLAAARAAAAARSAQRASAASSTRSSERVLEGLDDGYRRLLHWALGHRVGGGRAERRIGRRGGGDSSRRCRPSSRRRPTRARCRSAPSSRRARASKSPTRCCSGSRASIAELVPEATDVIVNAGGGGPGFGGPGGSGAVNRGQLQLLLKPKDERTRSSDQIAQDLRRQLAGIPGVIVRANASGGNQQMNRFLSGGNNGGGRLSLEIRGESLDDARKVAQAAKELLDTVPGVADARLGRDDGRPELAVRVDRAKAALLGVSATTVANTIRTNIAGTQAALFRQGGQEYPIIVRLREDQRQDVGDVNDVLVSTPQGQVLQAKNLMRVEDAVGPSQIQRKNQQRIAYVSAEPETTLSEAVDAVQERLPQIYGLLPKDFSIGFGAEVEQQAKAFDQLRMVLILALVLVYAVMASQYESLRDPFIIMFSVPTAAIGVVLALKLTGTSFNMQAYIGIIMLAGIVVSNGILLVDYTNVLRRRDGMPLREAVELAGRTRLRPILMTSIATGLGLVPMSLGIGEGSELQVPLARVVIGGLTTSLLITLVLVPTVYTLFEEGIGGLWSGPRKLRPSRHKRR